MRFWIGMAMSLAAFFAPVAVGIVLTLGWLALALFVGGMIALSLWMSVASRLMEDER